MAESVYIHIPFCRSKCHYCSFVSYAKEHLKAQYMKALEKEIRHYYKNEPLKTLYLGGGTPSLLSADEFADADSSPVFIFPKRGEKYHSAGCAFLKAASTSGALTSSLRSRYKSCPLCHSGKAGTGTLVYYFPSAGEDYHLAGCPSLQRNYIEIDKTTAAERGYTACSKCGG